MKKNLLITCVILSLLFFFCAPLRAEIITDQGIASQQEPIGSGDGRIHIIPSLSSQAVKNGETLTITAVVTAKAGVEKVEAEIESLEIIPLQPASGKLGGVRGDGTMGMWRAEWIGHDLEEKFYTVTLRVTDREGHVFEDQSLRFSDPIAGWDAAVSAQAPPSLLSSATLEIGEDCMQTAVIDADNGYAYFATGSLARPWKVVKVELGSGTSAPVRIGALTVNEGGYFPDCATIDAGSGYAYYGTRQGAVIKIALGSGSNLPTFVGFVKFESTQGYLINLSTALIDSDAGYAYFGGRETDLWGNGPCVVLKAALGTGDDLPNLVGIARIEDMQDRNDRLISSVIDPAAGYAYFGTNESPGRIHKISLGSGDESPSLVNSLSLFDGEESLYRAVIDTGNGFAYFGTYTSPGQVIKVGLGEGDAAPTRIGSELLDFGENFLWSAGIDMAGGYAYFGTSDYLERDPVSVVKVSLGTENNPPARVGTLAFEGDAWSLRAGVIDPVHGYGYYCVYGITNSDSIVKFALGEGAQLPTELSTIELKQAEEKLSSAVVDHSARYMYFGTQTRPGQIIKVAMGSISEPPSRVGFLELQKGAGILSGEDNLDCAVIDPAAGYAYFGTDTSPGNVVKIALGNGNEPPRRIGSLVLQENENKLKSAVIDSDHGYAYFGTYTSPGQIIKVALGVGDSLPQRIGALTLETGEDYPISAVIDPVAGYAWFGTGTQPGHVVKVALGQGDNLPTRVGAETLIGGDPGEDSLQCAVIDTEAGYAYFGTATDPGRVIKVALGEGDDPPQRIARVTLGTEERYVRAGVIDPAMGFAWFTSGKASGSAIDGSLFKILLGEGNSAPLLAGSVALGEDSEYVQGGGALIDTEQGLVIVGTNTDPGYVRQYSASQKGMMKASIVHLSGWANVTDIHFYSHSAEGNIRLAIYNTTSPQSLLWESNSVVNTAAEDWVVVPVSSGTPDQLTLGPGQHWIAWQIDTDALVPSYHLTSAGYGLFFPMTYGAFPSELDSLSTTLTNESWSTYITYNSTNEPTATPTGMLTSTPSTPSPTPTNTQTTPPTTTSTPTQPIFTSTPTSTLPAGVTDTPTGSTPTPTNTQLIPPTVTLTSTPTLSPTPAGGPEEIVIPLPGLPENVTPMVMVKISSGSFEMGTLDTDSWGDTCEKPQHTVNIGYDFYIGKYEITQAQWEAVMGSNPATAQGVGDDYPVHSISWDDCQNFVTEINKLGQGIFRLPSSAEWEYSCRAGTSTRFYFGDSDCDPNLYNCDSCELNSYAWWCGSDNLTGCEEVGQLLPNSFGLYDMHGNVSEWNEDDWHGSGYDGAPDDGSAWINSPRDTYRAIRSGNWYFDAKRCRAAAITRGAWYSAYGTVGLRLVREATDPIVDTPTPSPTSILETPTPTLTLTETPIIVVPTSTPTQTAIGPTPTPGFQRTNESPLKRQLVHGVIPESGDVEIEAPETPEGSFPDYRVFLQEQQGCWSEKTDGITLNESNGRFTVVFSAPAGEPFLVIFILPTISGDIDGDGEVGTTDIFNLINNWHGITNKK